MGNGDLVYSPEAKLSLYWLFQDSNDINFFVEDEGKAYEYETIFSRIFGDSFRFKKIFDVGGKSKLVEAYNEFGCVNSQEPSKKNYYIADGDFDRIIHSDEMIKNEQFIYLEAYNIENYLIDKSSVESFAKGKIKDIDTEVEEKIDFENWRKRIVEESKDLFFLYCYVQKIYPEIKTLSRSPYKFIDDKTGYKDLLRDDIEEFKNSLPEGYSINQEELENIKNKYYSLYEDEYNLICGKFLLTSLSCHIRNVCQKKFEIADLRWHLILFFDVKKLDFIKEVVLRTMLDEN